MQEYGMSGKQRLA